MMFEKITELLIFQDIAKTIRKQVVLSLAAAGSGHLGGSLGLADVFTVKATHPIPVEMNGMNDWFGELGKPEELMQKYRLVAGNIAAKAKIALSRK
jgi:transketolase